MSADSSGGEAEANMSDSKRRFFSGDTLQQALVQAANHYHLQPEEIAYHQIEKRHGFTKVRRKFLIEVDPEAPGRPVAAAEHDAAGDRSPLPAASGPAATADAAAAPEGQLEGSPMEGPPMAAERPEGSERSERPERPEGFGRPERPERPERQPSRTPSRAMPGGRTGRSGEGAHGGRTGFRGRPSAERPSPAAGMERGPRHGGQREGQRGGMRRPSGAFPRERRFGDVGAGGLAGAGEDLVTLPETPRNIGERYPAAEGPQAAAAARGVELLLRFAGLNLTPHIYQGEERLEIDLVGPDTDWCFADDGELLMAIEHLLPRIIRSLSGEAVLCRVDCDNFHEIREERLRSLAQKVADEVRQRGRSRTLVPMNPADRRIIHVTLADDPAVVTESEGEGYFKRITVRPA
jgi:predicted RNA-binding protein Jag